MANIKDLKIGDIITATAKQGDERFVLIYNGINENYCNCIRSFCHVFNEAFFCPKPCDTLISADRCFIDKSTVEEVQVLFHNIHKWGYRWDEEKLELVAIPSRTIDLTKDVQVMHGAADGLEWISVDERLPDEGVHVWVLGVADDSIPVCYADGEDHSNDPRRPAQMWICKRTKKDRHTDGNGFLRIYPFGQFVITHWFPIPKLDSKEIYPTLPV